MKPGEEFECEFCNKHSFLIKKTIMDGWTKKNEVLSCSSCGKIIEEIKTDDLTGRHDDTENDKLDKLAKFLGTEKEKKKTIKSEEKKFCRDCEHYIIHPFVNRCGLKDIEVHPMDDCGLFKRKK